MIERLTTPNILEVTYLLDRQHWIVDVEMAIGWPYVITELVITMEGQDISLDRATFLRHSMISLASVAKTIGLIHLVIDQKIEGSGVGSNRLSTGGITP